MEGLIELGALICKKTPLCTLCPLQQSCKAFQKGKVEDFPKKAIQKARINLHRFVMVLEHKSRFLVIQRPLGSIMGGLYEFPYEELSRELSQEELVEKAHSSFSVQKILFYPKVQHGFTRYLAKLFPVRIVCTKKPSLEGEWKTREELQALAFSSGHKKVLDFVIKADDVTFKKAADKLLKEKNALWKRLSSR